MKELTLDYPRKKVTFNTRGQIFIHVTKDQYEQAEAAGTGAEISLRENGEIHHNGEFVARDTYIGSTDYYGYLLLRPDPNPSYQIHVEENDVIKTEAGSHLLETDTIRLDDLRSHGIGTEVELLNNEDKVFLSGLYIDGWYNAKRSSAFLLLRSAD